MPNNLLAGVSTNPAAGGISNPVFKGTILETYAWPDTPTAFFDFLVKRTIVVFLIIGTLWFFTQFILGAINWIGSAGDKQALENAKARITNALVGLIVLFSVFAVLRVIEQFFGISILTLDILPFAI